MFIYLFKYLDAFWLNKAFNSLFTASSNDFPKFE